MSGLDDRADGRILDIDTSEDVHVVNTTGDTYVFYTEEEEGFIRADCVVDVAEHR